MKKWIAVAAVALSALFGAAVVHRIRVVAGRPVPTDPQAAQPVRGPIEPAEIAYDGKLGAGWRDWGWGPHELPSSPGPAKVVFSGYGGIVLHRSELRPGFGGLSFRYKAPVGWPEFLAVAVRRAGSADSAFPRLNIDARKVVNLADGWREVLLGWNELNPQNLPIDRISISARAPVPGDWVLIDKVMLLKPNSRTVAKAPVREVRLAIACDGAGHPINPLIYGAAVGDWESGQSAQRIGGNLMSRLNWEAGLWNAGNDWFFENGKANGSVDDWLQAGVSHHVPNALTVPMLGWVAKDDTSVGFPRSKFGKQRKFDNFRPSAGDGFKPDGSKIRPGPATETSIAAPPELIGRWIARLRKQDAARGTRSTQMYILDNEPSLWSSTHRDVHPDPLGYDELLERTVRYATEIRKADPEALIAGPAEWGWRGYFLSGKDQEGDPALKSDRLAHGDIALIPWYLQKLAALEKTSGKRLLDVLDVHFYPAATGIYGPNPRVDEEGAALRLRSTRALWDPNYKDESWINEPVRLIPRLKQWVAENYPGLKISIGEWSFGADVHISGGLATVEALGHFGEEGLDSAFFWDGPKPNTATFWAFRAFRNFDGAGGRFLDTSLPTRGTDDVSLFASRDQSGKHVVAIVVNRDPAFAVSPRFNLETCGNVVSSRTFVYGPGSTRLVEAPEPPPRRANDRYAAAVVGPYSFAVVDIHLARP